MILTVTLNAAIDKRYEVSGMATGQVNRVDSCRCGAGGKGLNVSRVAALTGEQVTATGFVGGHTGRLIEELAHKDGIKTDFVHTKEESRTCINILDTTTGIQTEFLEPGSRISGEKEREMREKYRMLLAKTQVVAISGSVPKGIANTMYPYMIGLAKEAGIPVLLDTSGELLVSGIQAEPELIKPNQDEIRQLLGRTPETEEELWEAGKAICQKGIHYVVISLGGEGSMLITEQECYRARVPKLVPVNTVGCGDAMLAGFAAGIRRGLSCTDMLALASAVSAANALRKETGYYVQEDFENLYQNISIERTR